MGAIARRERVLGPVAFSRQNILLPVLWQEEHARSCGLRQTQEVVQVCERERQHEGGQLLARKR